MSGNTTLEALKKYLFDQPVLLTPLGMLSSAEVVAANAALGLEISMLDILSREEVWVAIASSSSDIGGDTKFHGCIGVIEDFTKKTFKVRFDWEGKTVSKRINRRFCKPHREVVAPVAEMVQDVTTSSVSVEESDDSDEDLEVEEREWEGETYVVDPETNIIYDPDSGEEIGTWGEDGPMVDSGTLQNTELKEECEDSSDGLELEEREWEGETCAVDPGTDLIYNPESGEVVGIWGDDGPLTDSATLQKIEEDFCDGDKDVFPVSFLDRKNRPEMSVQSIVRPESPDSSVKLPGCYVGGWVRDGSCTWVKYGWRHYAI